MACTITVNGARRTVDVEADRPPLRVRDELQLKAPSSAAGCPLCGAGAVHLNPMPTRSCITPISSAGDATITIRPSGADIDQAMSDNLCRCAINTRIRAAIKQAAGLPTTDTREV